MKKKCTLSGVPGISRAGRGTFSKILQIMRLATILLIATCLQASAKGYSQITLSVKNAPMQTILKEIQRQCGYDFIYSNELLERQGKISVEISNGTLEKVMEICLQNTSLDYKIVDNTIVIQMKLATPAAEQQREKILLKGSVKDSRGGPVIGAAVIVKGTKKGVSTDIDGIYELNIDHPRATLIFSCLGMKTKEVAYNGQKAINVVLEDDAAIIEDLVVTGMFTRKAESFTGSTTTIKGDELRQAGNQNILASLKNIDPSFILTESVEFGSNPNIMPEIQMRGQTSIPNLKGDYESNPNQPLFILDGFETSIEKVYDLNMNLISSITLLKDAAAKAIYGSKAANGVVVIETIQPKAGKLRVSYNGSMDITAPDLTSYNLCNSEEKLQAELLAGKYYSSNPATQAKLTSQYNEVYKEIAKGVDSYWLSQPLRTGVGQKHSLYIDGGDDAMKYSANVGYNRINGVMKGSDRSVISGVITLSYRYKNLIFRNNLSVDNNDSHNSLYGSFSQFANMNPYLRIWNENGSLIKTYGDNLYNPIYNSTIGGKDRSGYSAITENFYGEWSALKNLKFTARLGVDIKNSDSEVFKPASHTDYSNVQTWDENYATRGEYTKVSGKTMNTAADAGVSYTIEKNKHLLFANAMFSISQAKTESYGITVVGFPSDKLDYIGAGNNYAEGKPTGTEATSRLLGLTMSFNYSYDNRYLADFSWRTNGSSQFGAKERFGKFWSAGIGWNLHHEKFMKEIEFIDMLKLRASLGYTGSVNFSAYQAIPTYKYITDNVYDNEMGMILANLANENLRWQKQYDRNIGFDGTLFNFATIRFDYYSNVTTDLLADISVSPSVGFSTYTENMGETLNRGFQVGSSFKLYSDAPRQRYINLNLNILKNTNKIRKISDALKAYNEQVDALKEEYSATDEELQEFQRDPSLRFEEGQSLTAIWAVRSAGIDPVNGKEVFIKKDGTYTYTWSASDQVVCGDTSPKINGNIGINFGWGPFSTNFAFTFKYGGQTYNSTLVNKIENVDISNNNVDVRALTERWTTPGQEAKYKAITDNTITKSTSRFVEDLNEFVLSSIHINYDLSSLSFIKKSSIERLKVSFNMNDVGRFSTVRQERGSAYPFARIFSFGLQANF